jgi:hypothetical protein
MHRHVWSAAALIATLALGAGCTPVATAISADAPQVAATLDTICNDLVPAAEATADALAKGGAAATIQSAEAGYVTPACAAARSAASAVDSGWLATVIANVESAMGDDPSSTPAAAPSGGK